MKVGYARVSSISQNLDRQIEILKENDCEKIFTEKKSGKNIKDREVFQEVLDFVREADTLVVESLDRLGRDYDEIIETINKLKEKKVKLIITSLPIMNEMIGNELLDKFMKDLIIQILAMISEQERAESKRRQAQGIANTKAKNPSAYSGKPFEYSSNARDPKKRIVYQNVINQLNNNEAISKIAKENGITRQTVYAIKKRSLEAN
ncbi:recombinase family protein [Macrococcoides caseolyticum]|uniref:recombinase family protein n=1 Tax=Macrococcoides caseolyticum TaxID=69966 RepID=UPI000C34816E|nr:recombinase family protein [Macrococcus caseolyticus]PKE22436.1 transposon DNA-invertase [Macrococcus caseolyticus]PKE35875.1 transposon DNA-invertase [Macrococcus caseolyticus]PKE73167.1 transposon DNA-invertase [Macrococcus caseolyticus]PKE74746.1 transposon DNA-invertase [Macrococcus caseolyticus]PKF07737.1 transposon DNA-invertase [Macrococcus caseolyticus]